MLMARGPRPSRFSQPYSAREALWWILKNAAGPPPCRWSRLRSLPTDSLRHVIKPRLSLGFVGDILPLRKTVASLDPAVRQFFAGVDYVIGNFEGTLVDDRPPWVFMGQPHDDAALALLRQLAAPERTVLLCANNHSLDYGVDTYRASVRQLRSRGYTVADHEWPCQRLVEGVSVVAGTAWSNQRRADFAPLAKIAADPPKASPFRILCPHWGYELEHVPRRAQITDGDNWLRKWSLVVGHHSHTPQPIVERSCPDRHRVIAYSLGNFTFAYNLTHHRRGLVVRVDIGPGPDGGWDVGRLRWARVESVFTSRHRVQIRLCQRFPSA
jgi:hypothetical protein